MVVGGATANDITDQVRFRLDRAQREFAEKIEAIKSTNAAAGRLKSGATIRQLLRLLETEFQSTADDILEYAAKLRPKSSLTNSEFLSLMASLLGQASLAFKSAVKADQLRSFGASRGVDAIIDKALDDVDTALTLKMREFALALEGSVAAAAPAVEIRYVQIQQTTMDEVVVALAELKDAVRGTNDVTEDIRSIGSAEIAAFEATIIQPRVATDLIQRFVDRVVGWLRTMFAGAVVATVAQKLVEALLPLLTTAT